MGIELNMPTILCVASCIITISGAIKAFIEMRKIIGKPLDEVNTKLALYYKWLQNDKKHLENIDVAIEEIGEAINLIISSQKITMSHLKDGNHTGEIEQQVKRIDDWLIERKDYRI